MLNGKAATDALLAHLKAHSIHYCPVINEANGRLLRLFIAMPRSIQHLAKNPNVLLMDATYKTNRFNMPLVDTVGIDNCNRTFFISFAFMSSETNKDYKWSTQCNLELYQLYVPTVEGLSIIATNVDAALIKAVHKKFPKAVALLCQWHVQKNILKHCNGGFVTDETWKAFEKAVNNIFYAKTKQDYEDQLQKFSVTYAWEKHPWFTDDYVEYIKSTWLTPTRKTQIVRAWTDQYLHFSVTTTSRIEGAHAIIKRFLEGSTSDLLTAWLGIEKAVANQLNKIRGYATALHSKVLTDVERSVYNQVYSIVTIPAIRLVEYQRQEIMSLPPLLRPCTSTWTVTMGLPCIHKYNQVHELETNLTADDFHPQ
jgi:hypothetical protein